MGVAVKFRRGTASEHSSFAGSEGEITVQKSDSSGQPWDLRVHDGLGGSGHLVPSADSTATLNNKVLNNVKFTGTISDNSGNTIATISDGKLVFSSNRLTLDTPSIVDQGSTVPLEQMVARVARKNQMILGD